MDQADTIMLKIIEDTNNRIKNDGPINLLKKTVFSFSIICLLSDLLKTNLRKLGTNMRKMKMILILLMVIGKINKYNFVLYLFSL